MLTYMLLSLGLVAIAFVGFAIAILVKKNGSFPETSISKNKELRKRKIYCIKTEQKMIDNQMKGLTKAGESCCNSC
jgi:hypothetical protein